MYYKKYKDNWYYKNHLNTCRFTWSGFEEFKINQLMGPKITRKNWNMQHKGCTNSEIHSKKWLKKICNRKIRRQKIELVDGNFYRRTQEYWWILS